MPSASTGRPSRVAIAGAMQTGSTPPGLERLGLRGLTSAQYRKLLRQMPVPGTTTPEPNTLPRLWVTHTTLPSRSAMENDVV